jgi:hypothetical protein
MRHYIIISLTVFVLTCLISDCFYTAEAGEIVIGNRNGVKLTFSETGSITSITVRETDLFATERRNGFSIRDVVANHSVPVEGHFTRQNNGNVLFNGNTADLGIELNATFSDSNGVIFVDVTVTDKLHKDRAIDAVFTMAFKGESWQFGNIWHSNSTLTENVTPGRGANQIDPINGIDVSQIPLGACLCPQTGIALAHSMKSPRFNAYKFFVTSNNTGVLSLTTALGLAAETVKFPYQARYSFALFGFAPEAGMRAAMAEYYRIFHDCFEHNFGDYSGGWALHIPQNNLKLAKRAGMGTNQKEFDYLAARDPTALVKEITDNTVAGLRILAYCEPWGIWHPFPKGWIDTHRIDKLGLVSSIDPTTLRNFLQNDANDKTHTADRFPGKLKRADIVKIIENTAIEPQPDSWGITYHTKDFPWATNQDRKTFEGAVILANSDPDLPSPNRWDLTWGPQSQVGLVARMIEEHGGTESIGVYLDSEAFGLGWGNFNYRRDHWIHTDVPLSYARDPKKQIRPALPMALSNLEFLRKNYDEAHRRGWCVAGNTWHPVVQFSVAYLDFVGAGEHWENTFQPQTDYRIFRFLAYRKPVSTMDYVLHFSTVPPTEEIIKTVHEPRCNYLLLYGIFPGTANAWNQPKKIALILPVMEKYAELIRTINLAGWQPLTVAKIEGEMVNQVLVERWGNNPENGLYFTIRAKNDDVPAGQMCLTFDTNSLKVGDRFTATELVDGKIVTTTIKDGKATLTFDLPAKRTLLIALRPK